MRARGPCSSKVRVRRWAGQASFTGATSSNPAHGSFPYFTAGLGGLYDDIYHNKVQRAIGGNFQFNLEGEIGLRFMLGRHSNYSIDVEAAYRHVSDASITTRNDGIDSVGGEIGFSVFF